MSAVAAALSGCTVVEHIQVMPIVNPDSYDVSCCVAYAEIPPSTHLSLTFKKGSKGASAKLGVRSRF